MLYSEAEPGAGAPQAAGEPGAPENAPHPAPFAPLPADARIPPVWAVFLLPIGFLLAALAPAIPVVFGITLYGMLQTGMTPRLEFWATAGNLLVSFPVFALMAWLWARVYERRGAGTIGLRFSLTGYLAGVLGGLALAMLLFAITAPFSPVDTPAVIAGLGRLATPTGALFMAVMAFLFIVQGGAEEVVFRGWALSAITARRGPIIGVIVSSLAFAAVHAHYLFFAPLTGLLVILGVVAPLGALFAFVALTQRSVGSVCGAHSAYNFALTMGSMAEVMGQGPDAAPWDLASGVFNDVTSVTEFDLSAPLSMAVLALLTLTAWAVWRRSRLPAAAS